MPGVNLLTTDQSTLEGGVTTGWIASGCTLSASTTIARTGSYSLRLSASSTLNVYGQTASGTSGMVVSPSTSYTASAWYRKDAAATGLYWSTIIDWYTSAGTLISTSDSSGSVSSGSWTEGSLTVVSPATAAYARLRVSCQSSVTTGTLYYVDDIFFGANALTITAGTTTLVGGATSAVVAAAPSPSVTGSTSGTSAAAEPAEVSVGATGPEVSWSTVLATSGPAAVTVAAPAPTVTGALVDAIITVPATSAVTAASNMPTITAGGVVVPSALAMVQVEFVAGIWTDVTPWWDAARPITMTAGRSDVDERVQPGRLSGLVLDNTDGRFTVGNAAGAYSPNVVSGKRVRVSIKDPTSNAYVPRFTGRIDGWPLEWADNGTTCWVTLSATDMLTDWAQADMPADYMYRWTARLATAYAGYGISLTDYWECTSLANDGTMANSVAGGAPLVNSGAAPTTFSGAGLPGDPRSAIQYAGGGWYRAGRVGAQASNSWFTFGWLRLDGAVESGNTTGYYLVTFDAMPAHRNLVVLRVKSTTLVLSTLNLSTGAWDDILTNTVNLSDKSWHSFRLAVAESGGAVYVSLHVDGEGSTSASMVTTDNMLANTWPRSMRLGTYARGTVAHVSYWEGPAYLTNVSLAGPAAGLPEGWPWERLGQVATLADLTTPTIIGVGQARISPTTPIGKALDMVPVVEATEMGILWCDGAGTVTYTTAPRRTETPTLALSITAADVSPDLSVAADRVRIANEVLVVNTTPVSVFRPDPTTSSLTLSDTASKAVHGRRSRTVDTAWAGVTASGTDPGYLTNVAASHLVTTEAPRIPTLPLDALTLTAAQQSAILAADVWDQIGVTDLPTAGGWDTKWLGRVEGWTETLGASEWRITFNTSFAGNRLGDATHGLILGASRLG